MEISNYEGRLTRLMDNLPGMAYVCQNDPEWTMVFVSSGCEALTGYTRDEIQDNAVVSYADLIHPDDRKMVWDVVQAGVLKNDHFQLTYRIITKSKEEKWVWERGCPVLREDGTLIALEGFICDVSAQVRAEQSLRITLERLDAALDAGAFAVWDWDLGTNTCFFSPRWFTMLEYEPDEMPSTFEIYLSLVHPEDRPNFTQALSDYRKGKQPHFYGRFRMKNRSGEYRWILSRAKTTQWTEDGSPARMVGTHADITEEVEAEASRTKIEEQIVEAQKRQSLGVLAAGIGHNFNNLLMAIRGNVELVRREITSDHPASSLMDDIDSATRRMATLCAQILEYAGKTNFSMEPVHLPGIISAAVELFKPSLPKRVFLFAESADDVPLVLGDPGQLKQVLISLLLNSVEAIGDDVGEIRIFSGNRKVLDQNGYLLDFTDKGVSSVGYAFLEVKDTGCGIPHDMVEKIFDPFFTTKFLGRGLGLPAVLGTIRSHKGAIAVQSAQNIGTTVTIILPAV